MATWWDTGAVTITDGATTTGAVDGRTWTVTGTVVLSSGPTVREELANAIADQVLDLWGVTVTPYPPTRLSPPHIWIEPDDPFWERKANKVYVWAYTATIVVSGRHQTAWDWFERLGPLLDDACAAVPGAVLHIIDAPDYEDQGEGRSYLSAGAHITIKRNKE